MEWKCNARKNNLISTVKILSYKKTYVSLLDNEFLISFSVGDAKGTDWMQ